MTSEADDDKLDLSAWAPPPASDVTDAVIARMRDEHTGIVTIDHAPVRTRWWVAGGAAAVVVASISLLWWTRGAPSAGPGSLTATHAQRLELDGATANLDPGASLTWRYDRDGLRVEQRGSATWSVTDRLRIAAGNSSIEATAANLRVEVSMNRQDLTVVATSALTAAAVALVTVIVYDGHVRASSAGQTISLAPGTTIQVVPDHPPQPVDLVGARPVAPPPPPEPPAPPPPPVPPAPPNYSAEVVQLRAACLADESRKQWNDLAACAARLASLDPDQSRHFAELADAETKAAASLRLLETSIKGDDLLSANSNFTAIPLSSVYKAAAMAMFAPFEQRAIEKLLVTARDLARKERCGEMWALATNAGSPAAASAIRHIACEGMAGPPAPIACDVDAAVAKGDNAINSGNYREALGAYRAAYKCKPETTTLTRAYLAACKAHDATAAKQLFHQLPAATQQSGNIIQICLAQQIDVRVADEAPTRKVVDPFRDRNPGRTPDPVLPRCQPAGSVDPFSDAPVCGDAASSGAAGAVDFTSVPSAEIFVDGVATGKSTPTGPIALPPGKHKVTYKVGDDRFTFTVNLRPGETVKMFKQLQ